MNKILENIKNFCSTHDIESAYLVGLNDESYLSDLDLVIVAPKEKHKIIRKNLQKINSHIDLRIFTDKENFMQNYLYFPFFKMRLIYGQELRKVTEDSERVKLVKISAMFFKSFLRNYYKHLLNKTIDLPRLLVDLNDFNYCDKYLTDLPESVISLTSKINYFRTGKEQLDQKSARSLTQEAIDASWVLIEILDNKLKKEFGVPDQKKIYLGKEPTIITRESAIVCRKYSEKSGRLFKRLKLLYLPAGFQFIFLNDNYVKNFYHLNMKFKYRNTISFLKGFLKKVVAIFYYLIP